MPGANAPAPPESADAPVEVATLTKRRDFLAARNGARAHTTAFVLQLHHRGDDADALRVGYTVTKKVGNAVLRNRIKRRLREAVRHAAIPATVAGCDAVLIARDLAATHPFEKLTNDLAVALTRAAGDRKLRQARNSGEATRDEPLQNSPPRGTSPAEEATVASTEPRALPAQ